MKFLEKRPVIRLLYLTRFIRRTPRKMWDKIGNIGYLGWLVFATIFGACAVLSLPNLGIWFWISGTGAIISLFMTVFKIVR